MDNKEAYQTIPLAKLVPSASNVRRVNAEAGRAELAASLEAHGLIQNLAVRKAEKDDKYEVVAGGRRLGALRQLMKEGRSVQSTPVTKTYPVRVVVQEEGSATELSLAENSQREAMHPVDEVTAYRTLVEQGMVAEDIAARFGQSVVTVRQRLKLASLSPRILDAMRAGEVSVEQAKALAISDDHQAQEAAWFGQDGWSRNPANLRAALTSAHVRANDRLARLVGLDAYEAAGGAVLRDLFAEDGQTFLTDRALLMQLAARQLDIVADEVRLQGWKWVEVSLDAGLIHSGGYGRIYPSRRAPSEAEEAELAGLGEQFDELAVALDCHAEDDPQIEVDEARLREVESRIIALQSAAETYDPKEQAQAGCLVTIGYDGEVQVTAGLVKPEDRKVLARAASSEPTSEGERAEVEEGRGLSPTLTEELTAIRTAALRVELANRPDLALAAVVHALAGALFYSLPPRSAIEVRGERRRLEPSVKEPDASVALTEWGKVLEGWGERLPGDPADLWGWLLAQPQDVVLDLVATVTAANLNAVQGRHDADPRRLAHANHLAEAVALDMRNWWTPQGGFLTRLAKADISTAMREAGCAEAAAVAVERGPKADGVLVAEKALDGTGWLPMPLRGAVRTGEDDTARLAAE